MDKKGVSMIALIITIIVIIILAVIVFLAGGNVVDQAGLAKFKSEMADFRSESVLAVSRKNVVLAQENFFEKGPVYYMVAT